MESDVVQRRRFGGSSADKTAFLRALGALERDPALRSPDWLARAFVSDLPEARVLLDLASSLAPLRALYRWGLERLVAGGYWYEISRVRHFDAILLDEASRGVPQVIVLGAGLDSRGYRFSTELAGTRVFEVDHPVTAARKRARLTDVFGRPPGHVAYVPVDLAEEELHGALVEAGFDPAAPVFVLWVGVSMYLSADSVHDVFRWVGGRPRGSSLAFDYLYRSVVEGPTEAFGVRLVRRLAARSGEPLLFGLDPEAVPEALRGCGLALRDHCGPEEIRRRWLRPSRGGPARRLGEIMGYVHAGVPAA